MTDDGVLFICVAVVFIALITSGGCDRPKDDPAEPATQVFTLKDGTRCVSVKGKEVLVCDFAQPVGGE